MSGYIGIETLYCMHHETVKFNSNSKTCIFIKKNQLHFFKGLLTDMATDSIIGLPVVFELMTESNTSTAIHFPLPPISIFYVLENLGDAKQTLFV